MVKLDRDKKVDRVRLQENKRTYNSPGARHEGKKHDYVSFRSGPQEHIGISKPEEGLAAAGGTWDLREKPLGLMNLIW